MLAVLCVMLASWIPEVVGVTHKVVSSQALDAADQRLLSSTSSEISVARALVTASSVCSLCCALSIILYFVLNQDSRRCGRRILFCLHVADVGVSSAWLLSWWVSPTPSTDAPEAEASPLCMAQGYLLVYFSLASYLWTACFAFHLYQILARRSKYPELYESRYHVISWGLPALTVCQLVVQEISGATLLGESGRPWCWFRTWSDYEWVRSGFHAQLALFYIPVAIVLVHNLATYISLLYHLSDILSTKMEERIWRRLLAYSWVFFLSFVWGIFAVFYQATSPNHELSPSMLYFMSFFTPLQGAMNAIAYGVNEKMRRRIKSGLWQTRQPTQRQ
ncbi:hypothetical protein Poli38472_006152 [Pythium oligandrum]|uniref:G-protein coupled receptors family 2 profile 2 domain-containing protein n=1 Tax=Pythium oligandrum TaxID=41045 RepID=A0A8K1FPT2_PYTOL|nr:hypothetical protein Poli38472_006152 [Pythium oligandrum]|eukprot:TMW68684.1 hypothetical protein Poli38472_006152 [Pythium oligandrum]